MIKFLFKTLIIVLLLLLLIPLSRLLIWMATHVYASLNLCINGTIDPLGLTSLFLIGLAIYLIVLAIKS